MLCHREARATPEVLCPIVCPRHRFPSGDFFMRRSFLLAGVAITMLATSFDGTNAQAQ
jgi:hypothetical protein